MNMDMSCSSRMATPASSIRGVGPCSTHPRPELATPGWPAILADNQPLAITATTNKCDWDGEPPDYHEIVRELVVADDAERPRENLRALEHHRDRRQAT